MCLYVIIYIVLNRNKGRERERFNDHIKMMFLNLKYQTLFVRLS